MSELRNREPIYTKFRIPGTVYFYLRLSRTELVLRLGTMKQMSAMVILWGQVRGERGQMCCIRQPVGFAWVDRPVAGRTNVVRDLHKPRQICFFACVTSPHTLSLTRPAAEWSRKQLMQPGFRRRSLTNRQRSRPVTKPRPIFVTLFCCTDISSSTKSPRSVKTTPDY